jgi:hypothetical protein
LFLRIDIEPVAGRSWKLLRFIEVEGFGRYKFSYSQLYSDDVDCERTRASFHVQLQRSKDGLNIPQVVVMDRAGMIRATGSGHGGCPALEIRTSLLGLINCLLN